MVSPVRVSRTQGQQQVCLSLVFVRLMIFTASLETSGGFRPFTISSKTSRGAEVITIFNSAAMCDISLMAASAYETLFRRPSQIKLGYSAQSRFDQPELPLPVTMPWPRYWVW